MKKPSSFRSARVIALTLACSLGASGCFGTFSTLHRVYEWNRSVDPNKYAQWGVWVATMVVPIYPSAVIFDMIFANSVEFWSGKNPMSAESASRTIHTADGQDLSFAPRPDGKIDVTIRAPGKDDVHLVVASEGDVLTAYDEHGLAAIATPEAAPTH
jgi:hypothetical protein